MTQALLLLVLLTLITAGFVAGRRRAVRAAAAGPIDSLPAYHGAYVAIWCAVPGLLIFTMWLLAGPALVEVLVLADLPDRLATLSADRLDLVMNDVRRLAAGETVPAAGAEVRELAARYRSLSGLGFIAFAAATLGLAGAGLAYARHRAGPALRARPAVESFIRAMLLISSTVAVFTTLGIVLSLLFEAIRFFQLVPLGDFLVGLEWSPQTAIREGQVGASGAFGAVPVFAGTLLVTVIAMSVAAPVGLMAAIYLSEYAGPTLRAVAKPLLEILAGIPTVVYGFFAALTVAPWFRDIGAVLGLEVASESALAAGAVMGIMIIPFVSSLSDDVINAVPQSLREGSFALGATKSETVRRIILPAALPGIVGALLLAVSRAIGETMIVVMAAGLAANLTANPLEAVTTVTVQIVTLLVGDQEFDSAKTLAAFALGLALLLITLALNVFALRVVNKYREKYD